MTATDPMDPAATASPAPRSEPAEPAEPGADPLDANTLSTLRDLIVLACPDAVPELIQGHDAATLLASIPAARAAWAHVIEVAATPALATPPPAPVPAGSAIRSYQPDPTTLSPLAKIRQGLLRE